MDGLNRKVSDAEIVELPLNDNENSENSFHPERPIKYKKVNASVKVYVWELPVRIFHWVNMIAIILLMVTGIYIGKPFVSASVPDEAYYSNLMGWARYIHFFAAFLFTASILYRFYWVFKGNKYATSNPFRILFWKEVVETMKFYLFLKNNKPHYAGHNPLAQLSYWIFQGFGSLVIIFTGFFMYFEPQQQSFWAKLFAWVPVVFGNSYSIRSWHHLTAWAFMLFILIHVYMVLRDDYLERNGEVSSMFTGYKIEPRKVVGGKDVKKK
ncbi:MAG: Ni/Fe-hydrogenase, b-type cytochrome subunit [Bacillota bacterium]|jgi:Ni/Fe-hydrogenase 1 B-type cytochrome subunit|nr:Ni/Fe-hydrogenase, b-type cytochrome subunit [Bacillota bacterium]MDP4155564.1 Ni/Fe-hydrogenase, b-type cytochrome subunit [Bacillota bacterium]